METLGNKNQQNSAMKYYCNICHYGTSRKCNYNTHLISMRHSVNSSKETFGNEIQQKFSKIQLICEECNKEFKTSSGLWKHKKKCITENNTKVDSNNSIEITPELIFSLIKQNNDFQQTIIEQNKTIVELSKNGTNNTINNNNNNNINSHNKTFNLQVFLNETCKDAMNISDFVESVKLQVSDLEHVGQVGYIEGISNIIIKNLKALDVNKRPVHCADQKREVMYVKEDNVWEKEDEANKKLRKAIRMIAHKNICMFKAFREKYPDCEEYDSKKNSQYNIIVYESMGGKGDNDYEKNTKIIKKIAKVVGIEKSQG
jgi:hypothetical protein